MTILYTVQTNGFIDVKNLSKSELLEIEKIYVNITNRCSCTCTFCIKNYKQVDKKESLWLPQEPELEEVISEFENVDINKCKEIIFCGFGEPLERADEVIEVCKYIKNVNPEIKIRINTNGLGNLIHGKNIVPSFEGLVDTISISLNAASKEKYLEFTRNKFGIESFDAMLEFTKECKKYIPNIVLTVVDVIGEEEIAKCRGICDNLGVTFRVRPRIV